MQRRTFLNLCPLVAAAAVAVRLDLADGGPFWHVSGARVCPDAPVHVDLAAHVPEGSQVRLRVDFAAGSHLAPSHDAAAGARHALTTPYPHDDLVPGDYTVYVELVGRSGRLLECQTVGTYRVRPYRFSA